MIYLAAVIVANLGIIGYLVRENRKLMYAAIAKHAGEIAVLERSPRKKPKPAESEPEKSYHSWRNPSEGVGP